MSLPTPRSEGYYMPAEWRRHEATWLSWPKNPLTFPKEMVGRVEDTYCEMISALVRGEKVKLLVDDKGMEEKVEEKLQAKGVDLRNIQFKRIKSADVWIRDYGPTFLLSSKGKAAVKWTFNAWGGKYDDLLYDNLAGEEVLEDSGVKSFRPGIVLEGGSIDVNGQGAVLTTEQCLLNQNRNPQLDRAQIESFLEDYLNAPKVVWLKSGIEGDDTDGHIDDFARFVSPRKVLCAYSERGVDVRVLRTNLELLRESRDQDGEKLEVLTLPMPRPIELREESRFLPASYANFYVGNRVVLLPSFNDENDLKAMEILQECFPNREMVGIEASDLVYGYGGIHCVTQQEPSLN